MTVKLPKIRLIRDEAVGLLYLFAFILRFFTNISKTVIAGVYVLTGFAVLLYIFSQYKEHRKLIMILMIIGIFSVIAGIVNGNKTYNYAIYNISSQMFGIILYVITEKNKMTVLHFVTEMMYWFIVVKILFFPYIDSYGDLGISQLTGKNSVSVLMLFFCALDILYRYRNTTAIGYLKFLIGIVVSYITDSSGGILCFTIIAIGMFACNRNKEKFSWVKISIIIFGGVTLLLGLGYIQKVIFFLSNDNSRFAIWEMYKNVAVYDFKSIIFGGNLGRYDVLLRLKNIHNTFLNWHAFYGLLPTVFYTIVSVKCLFSILKSKEWYSLVIIVALLIRAMTDSIDSVYMSLIVYLYLISNSVSKRVNNILRSETAV